MASDKKENYKNYVQVFTNAKNGVSAKEMSATKGGTTATTATRHHDSNMQTQQDNGARQYITHGQQNRTTATTIFTIVAETPPTCEILSTTSKEGIAKWQGILQRFNRERAWYNCQYNTNYDPPLWKWVAPEVLTILSAELLLPEDATDPCKGEPPNVSAVTDLLLQRGKYSTKHKNKVGAYGIHTDVLHEFSAIKWPTDRELSHTARLDKYLTTWFTLAATIYDARMPIDKPFCKIMIQAIQPDDLRKLVVARMYDGLGPDFIYRPTRSESWRKQARTQLRWLRRLIREHTEHADMLNSIPTLDYCTDVIKTVSARHTSETADTNVWSTSRPTCAVNGCGNLVNNKRRGGGYHKTCKEHAHLRV